MTKPTKYFLAHTSVSIMNLKPIWPLSAHPNQIQALSEADAAQRRAGHKAQRSALQSGQPLEAIEDQFALIPFRRRPKSPAPFMNFGNDAMVVTQPVRDLLAPLAPHSLRFFPITVLNETCKAPLWEGPALYVMQVTEVRHACNLAQSTAVCTQQITLPDGIATTLSTIGNPDATYTIALDTPVDDAADIWIDDRLQGAIFLSGHLAKALKSAGLARGWGLTECVLLPRA
ncbi:imm11 family protein [Gymnodinialimonas hymeniacidonis]|uniref:imm11 family protein n=1 Tax=Gymnodinialimonas hymeniacidonis TaxID=3126508 RepID=UPI0034C62AF9